MLVVQFDAEHRAGKHRRNVTFNFNMLFFHDWQTGNWGKLKNKKTRSPALTEPRLENQNRLVAITTAAAAEFTATTATAAGSAFFTRLGNVDCEGASVHILAVHGFDGLLGLLG